MSEPRSDQLFQLVKSLDANELRYIRKAFSSCQYRVPLNYKKIFDLYVAMRHQSTTALEHKLAESMLPKHTAVLRHQCFNWVLQRLRHIQVDVGDEIMGLIQEARILFDRDMFSAAGKKILAAKHLSAANLRHEFEGEIYRIMMNLELADARRSPQAVIQNIQGLSREFQLSAAGSLQSADFMAHAYQLVLLQHGRHGQNALSDIRIQALAALETPPESPLAKLYQLQCAGVLAVMDHDLERAYTAFSKIIDLYGEHSSLRARMPENHAITLHNLCQLSMHLRKRDETRLVLASLKELYETVLDKGKKPMMQCRHLLYYFGSMFAAKNIFLDYQEIDTEAKAFSRELQKFSFPKALNTNNSLINIFLNISILYIYNGNPSHANRWLGRIFREADVPDYLLSKANLLHAVLLHQLGETDLLETRLDHIRNLFPALIAKDAHAGLIVEFLQKANNATTAADQKQALKAAKARLASVSGSASEAFFDIGLWLNSL